MKIDYSLHYNKFHDNSENHYNFMAKYYYKRLKDFLPANKHVKILDIGCSYGYAVYALNRLGYYNVKGIDISPELIQVAKDKQLNVELVSNTSDWLNDSNDFYDLVIMFDVLEHIQKAEQIPFLRAIFSKLKAGGILICVVPNANSNFASRWRYIDWTHECSFSEYSLDFILRNAGFSDIEIKESELQLKPFKIIPYSRSRLIWCMNRFLRFIRRLEAIGEFGRVEGKKIPLSLNIISIAKK